MIQLGFFLLIPILMGIVWALVEGYNAYIGGWISWKARKRIYLTALILSCLLAVYLWGNALSMDE